jgi:hypothetical protein
MSDTASHLRRHPRQFGDVDHTTAPRRTIEARGRHGLSGKTLAREHTYDGRMSQSLRPSTSLFEDAIDIPAWLEQDSATSYAARVRRDRDAAAKVAGTEPIELVRGWWTHVFQGSQPSLGARLERTRRLIGLAMFGIGVAAGVGVAGAAFHYDGTRPINVVALLAALVVVQLTLLALSLLLLPTRLRGLRAIQDLLESINPGAFAAALFRRVSGAPRDVAQIFGWHPARATASGRFAKWQILAWAQTAAVGFNVAAIATAFALIAFTDLAFGWSTTLTVDPHRVHQIAAAIAWPWHAIAPSAVPDLALVERSQFFRLDGTRAFDVGASRELAGWWSFTVLAVATYGLLPRIAFRALCIGRLRAATRALLLEDARVTALLDRMTAPAVETAAGEPEDARPAGPLPENVPHDALVGSARAVVWGGSIDPAQADTNARRRLGIGVSAVVEAGGGRTLADDRAALDAIRSGSGPVVVFTRAWEPPMLEFGDFIAALRECVGRDASIVVSPIAAADGEIDETQRQTWARAVGRVADPRVYLEVGVA